jgi:hypothetical protein
LEVNRPPDPKIYNPDKPWDPPLGRPGSKREDPEIFPPIKLETAAITGALCVKAEEGEESLLASLENSPAPKKKRPKTKRRTGGGEYGSSSPYGEEDDPYEGEDEYGSEYGSEYGEEDPYGDEDRGRRDRGRRKRQDRPTGPERTYPATKVCGYRPFGAAGGMMGSGGMDDGDMPGLGSPAAGGAGGGAGMSRPGMDGPGMFGGAGDTGVMPGQPVAQPCNAIVVKALAPYRKQSDEFKRVLGDAIGYEPMRDQPRIIFFQAQRADVTDNPSKELAEEDWKIVMHPNKARKNFEDQRWHGVADEVADLAYVDSNITMPVPPIMLRCLDEIALHSEVPRGTRARTVESPGEDEDAEEDDGSADVAEGSDLPGGLPPGRGARGSGFPGSGFPGSGFPGSGYPGSDYPGYGSGMGDYDGEYDGGEYDGYDGYGSGYPGAGYPGSSYYRAEPAQYKLVRFFDLDVEEGRIYRYRIRLLIEDPNNPNTKPERGRVSVPPRRRTLSTSVIERLNEKEADEKTKDSYYRFTDWSEATEPVSLPSPSRVFVGKVDAARMVSGAGGTLIRQSEVRGNVVPVVWNQELAIDVGAQDKAYRGSILNLDKQFDVLDPVTLVIKILKEFPLNNQYLVVDMGGGEDLPGDRKHLVKSAGEYLLVDDRGNFVVRNELDDYEKYRRYTFADELTSASRAMPGYGDGFEGSFPGLGSPAGSGPGMGGRPGKGPPGNPGGAGR